jgi:hypothetical protein
MFIKAEKMEAALLSNNKGLAKKILKSHMVHYNEALRDVARE